MTFNLTLAYNLSQQADHTVCVFQMNFILSVTKIKRYCLRKPNKSALHPKATLFTYQKIVKKNHVKHWSVLTLATSNCRTLLLTFSARVEVKETMLDSCLESVSKIWRLGLSKMKDKNIKLSLWIICNGIEEIMTEQTGFQAGSAVRCSTNCKIWHQWLNPSDRHTLFGVLHAFDF